MSEICQEFIQRYCRSSCISDQWTMKMNGLDEWKKTDQWWAYKYYYTVCMLACRISACKFMWFSWQYLYNYLSILKKFLLTWIFPACDQIACAFSFKYASYKYMTHFLKMSPKKENLGLRSRWSVYSWYYCWHAPCALLNQ